MCNSVLVFCVLHSGMFVCLAVLLFSEVSNGSSSIVSEAGATMLSLNSKTSSLSLCSNDPSTAGGSDHQKNGVVHSCS